MFRYVNLLFGDDVCENDKMSVFYQREIKISVLLGIREFQVQCLNMSV